MGNKDKILISNNSIDSISGECNKKFINEGPDKFHNYILEKQPEIGLFIFDIPKTHKQDINRRFLFYTLYQSYVLCEIYNSVFNVEALIRTNELVNYLVAVTFISLNFNGDLNKSDIPSIQPNLFDYILSACKQYSNKYGLSKNELGMMGSVLISIMLALENKTNGQSK